MRHLFSSICKKLISASKVVTLILVSILSMTQVINAKTHFAGATLGDFQVSSSGAASYAIPLTVPPGIKGMQPNLALTYSSQSGNGLLGMGWNLSGLSAITRCPQTLAQDGNIHGVDFTAEDRFCLDGQRFVPVSAGSNEYRTEMESYSKITAIGGTAANPNWFEVRTKDGKIKQYGNTPDSFVNAIDALDGTVKADAVMWTINKISDHSTNYINFIYTEDLINGDHYISRIDYTGNVNAALAPFSYIQFLYESHPDRIVNYRNGTRSSTLNRLVNVKTFSASEMINNYLVRYKPYVVKNHLQVDSFTQCTVNNKCLPSINLKWVTDIDNIDVQFNSAISIPTGPGEYLGHSNNTVRLFVADFNGDGRADLFNAGDSANNALNRNNLYLSNGQGFDSAISVPTGPGEYLGHSNRTVRLYVGDFNGDGMADLLNAGDDAGNALGRNNLYLSNGKGFNSAISIPTGPLEYLGHSNQTVRLHVADFNGDGKADLLNVGDSADNALNRNNLYLSNGNGFDSAISVPTGPGEYLGHSNRTVRLFIADFNGDGMADLLNVGDDANNALSRNNLYLSNGHGFDSAISVPTGPGEYLGHSNSTVRLYVADFNGDGMADLFNAGDDANNALNRNNLYISNGRGFNSAISVPTGPGEYLGHSNSTVRLYVADFNGDGMVDLLNVGDNPGNALSRNNLYLSNGHGFNSAISVPTGPGEYLGHSNRTVRLYVADFSGDGIADLFNAGDDANNALNRNKLHINKTLHSGLISSINNGNGEKTNINYKSITDSTIRTWDMADNLCKPGEIICSLFPMYVVSDYNKSNGVGGLYSHSYHYSGIKRNILGRGSLGFEQVTMTDNQTNVVLDTIYRQDFPFIGVTASVLTKQQNGKPLSKTINSWFDLYSSPNQTQYSVKPNSSESHSYELNGIQTTHVSTTTTYGGAFGEATELFVNSNDGYTKRTTNTYYPADTANWIISQLNTMSVTSLTPIDAGTRKSKFTYVPGRALVQSEIIEPGNVELEITKTYGHDVYGNKVSTTITGNAGAKNKFTTRSSNTSFDYSQLTNTVNPSVKITSTNALRHSSSKIIDARYGKTKSITGINGITTRFEYDALGRKVKEIRADGSSTTIAYQICEVGTICIDPIQGYLQSPLAVKTTTTDGISSNSSVMYFDKLGRESLRMSKGFNGKTIRKKTEYDIYGRVSKVSLPYFNEIPTHNAIADPSVYWTNYTFDLLGRMTVESKADGSTSTVAYNGLTTSTTNNLWQKITKVKNSQGQLVKSSDPYFNSNTYKYNAFGKMLSVTDAVGNVSRMAYDIRGRKISMNDADMGAWSYEYNAIGELVSQKDAKLQTMKMTYDVLGRMKSRTESEGVTNWTYDTAINGKGKLHSVTGPNSYSRTHQYDSLGRPKSITVQYGANSFVTNNTYIANSSRINTTTYPGGQVIKYGYDAFGYLNQLVDGATNVNYWKPEFTDAFGNVTQEVIGGKIITTRTFTPTTGRIETIMSGLTASSSSIQNLSYSFDSLANLKSRQDNNISLSEIFTYDDLNRLLTSQLNGLPQKSFIYDAIGNITNKSDVGAYSYDNGAGAYTTLTGGPHAVHKVGTNTYTYDQNGNQLSGSGRTLTYTSFNKPATISRGSVSNSIYYDAEHNRIEKVSTNAGNTTTTFYLGKSYQQVKSSGGLVEDKYFISAGSATVLITKRSTNSNDVRYLLKDHIGSTEVITDAAGVLVSGGNQSFDAWGKRRQGNWTDASLTSPIISLTSQGFTGHEMDDGVGLINMNARMYDAEIGRFLSADTIIQFPGSTQGYNRYTYVNNNPLSFTDPTGHSLESSWKDVVDFVDKHKKSVARYFSMGWLSVIAYSKPVKDLFIREKWARQVGGIIAAVYGQGYGAAVYAAYLSDIQGASDEDILKSGAMAYVSYTASQYVSNMDQGSFSDNLIKTGASGVAGGIQSEMNGGKFSDGFQRSALMTALSISAIEMRKAMIKQSKLHKFNSSGKSVGFRGDGFKLAGGRWDKSGNFIPDDPFTGSPMGGWQGGKGRFAFIEYEPGSIFDYVSEAYAGPHDMFNSGLWYNSLGDINQGMSTFATVGGNIMNYANIVFVTPLVVASVIEPYSYVLNDPLYN